MKLFFLSVLLVASAAQASMQLDTDYDLPNGAHKRAKLFLADKDIGAGHWITLPSTANYKVRVEASRHDELVDLRFRLSEKIGGKEKLLAAPAIRTRLGEPAEIRQGRGTDGTLLRVKATASEMDG